MIDFVHGVDRYGDPRGWWGSRGWVSKGVVGAFRVGNGRCKSMEVDTQSSYWMNYLSKLL